MNYNDLLVGNCFDSLFKIHRKQRVEICLKSAIAMRSLELFNIILCQQYQSQYILLSILGMFWRVLFFF